MSSDQTIKPCGIRNSVSQTYHTSGEVGDGGWIYFDSSPDSDRFSIHGVSYWSDGAAAWNKMVTVPGGAGGDWWLKTPFRVRAPKKQITIGAAGYSLGPGGGLLGPGNYNNISVAVGTDGYVYFGGYQSSPISGTSLAITIHLYDVSISSYE